MLRFGLIGAGFHGRGAVMPAIINAANCELAAVAELSPQHLEQVQHPGVKKYADYREMIRNERLDAVYIATLVEAHCALTVAALQAGLHVVCEKPMAASVAECEQMVAEAERAGRRLAITFEGRYKPYHVKIRQWIDEGLLGTVEAMHVQHFWDCHKAFGRYSGRRGRFIERSGSLDCGIHSLDVMRFFAGGGKWRDILAMGAWFGETFDNPPHISIMARLSTGPMITFNCSFAYTAYIEPRAMSHGLTIVGTKGVINETTDAQGAKVIELVSADHSETIPVEKIGHRTDIAWLLEDFAGVVEGRKTDSPTLPTLPTGRDGLAAQHIVDEANRLAREGRR